jgi:hypothetical protein
VPAAVRVMQPDQREKPRLAHPGVHRLLCVPQALERDGPVLGADVRCPEDG